MLTVKAQQLLREPLEKCHLRNLRHPCVRVFPRCARVSATIHALHNSPDQQIQLSLSQRVLQAAGHFAIAVSLGFNLTYGEVFATPLQGPSIDSDIAAVTSTLKEAWGKLPGTLSLDLVHGCCLSLRGLKVDTVMCTGKVGHIYYDTTFNNQDWNKVLEVFPVCACKFCVQAVSIITSPSFNWD